MSRFDVARVLAGALVVTPLCYVAAVFILSL
jgi:hypothetical protein